MNKSSSRLATQLEEDSLGGIVLRWPRFVRLAIGLLSCALISYFTALLLISVTGRWMNRSALLLDILIESSVLAALSLLGYLLGQIRLTALIVLGAFLLYEIQHFMRMPGDRHLLEHWPEFFLPSVSVLLNQYLFAKYAQTAELTRRPRAT